MEKEKPFSCETCGKRYKNLNGLKYVSTSEIKHIFVYILIFVNTAQGAFPAVQSRFQASSSCQHELARNRRRPDDAMSCW